jgi:hypothetical protein
LSHSCFPDSAALYSTGTPTTGQATPNLDLVRIWRTGAVYVTLAYLAAVIDGGVLLGGLAFQSKLKGLSAAVAVFAAVAAPYGIWLLTHPLPRRESHGLRIATRAVIPLFVVYMAQRFAESNGVAGWIIHPIATVGSFLGSTVVLCLLAAHICQLAIVLGASYLAKFAKAVVWVFGVAYAAVAIVFVGFTAFGMDWTDPHCKLDIPRSTGLALGGATALALVALVIALILYKKLLIQLLRTLGRAMNNA